MTLRQTMARDAIALTNQNEFGEQIVYVFKNGAPNRSVVAVVDRQDSEPAAGNVQQVARLRAVVEIPNSATVGITVVVPGDKVILAMRLGEAASTARVTRLLAQDEGMFRVEVVA